MPMHQLRMHFYCRKRDGREGHSEFLLFCNASASAPRSWPRYGHRNPPRPCYPNRPAAPSRNLTPDNDARRSAGLALRVVQLDKKMASLAVRSAKPPSPASCTKSQRPQTAMVLVTTSDTSKRTRRSTDPLRKTKIAPTSSLSIPNSVASLKPRV